MSTNERWLLPEGIEEVLPEEARRLETLRRRVLDLFDSWGYELVMPPMLEYIESLLTGIAKELDLQTFKLTDQLTGRSMGIRADMTPQAARIDAHYLKRETAVRLCYLGTVLRTRPAEFAGSREPLQLGAEFFGHAGPASDVEVVRLMLATLAACGIDRPYIDLGHVGVFKGLAAAAKLTTEQEADLFDALQRKARPEVAASVAQWGLDKNIKDMFVALLDLHGDDDVLTRARKALAQAPATVHDALVNLETIARAVNRYLPQQALHFDLAELHGYRYYTGVVFSAFVPGHGLAVAQGGRYDDIGKVFGRARAAAGFSADLRALAKLTPLAMAPRRAIAAPPDSDAKLQEKIAQLRAAGERVVIQVGSGDAACAQKLFLKNGAWVVVDN